MPSTFLLYSTRAAISGATATTPTAYPSRAVITDHGQVASQGMDIQLQGHRLVFRSAGQTEFLPLRERLHGVPMDHPNFEVDASIRSGN